MFYSIFFISRTGQEEMRIYLSSTANLAKLNSEIREERSIQIGNDSATNTSDLLTTNSCIYIHGTLITTLFVVAITRYVKSKIKTSRNVIYFIMLNVGDGNNQSETFQNASFIYKSSFGITSLV